jgi:hypothetical protein
MNCLAGSDILLGKAGAAVQMADWMEASDAPAAVKGALQGHNNIAHAWAASAAVLVNHRYVQRVPAVVSAGRLMLGLTQQHGACRTVLAALHQYHQKLVLLPDVTRFPCCKIMSMNAKSTCLHAYLPVNSS